MIVSTITLLLGTAVHETSVAFELGGRRPWVNAVLEQSGDASHFKLVALKLVAFGALKVLKLSPRVAPMSLAGAMVHASLARSLYERNLL